MSHLEIELKFPVQCAPPAPWSQAVGQRNHYFVPLDGLSVRTRQDDGEKAILVKKKGADPVNGVNRIESAIQTYDQIEDVDAFVMKSLGLDLWAKWARTRQTCTIDGFDCCLDINSGYGMILEIEGPDESAIRRFAKDQWGLTYALTSQDLSSLTEEYVANWDAYYTPFLEGDRTVLSTREAIDARIMG
jgi:adenylate cyclase class IV